jgi:uncharacterized protein (TIGR03437 family)
MNSTLKLSYSILRLCAALTCALVISQGLPSVEASTPRLDRISPTRVTAGAENVTVTLSGTSFAGDDQVFVNNTAVAVQSQSLSSITIVVPDNLLASAGVLNFEVRALDNTVSAARALVVIDQAKLNPQTCAIVLASSYDTKVAPGAIASAFGTHLATTSAFASSLPLPTNLGNTRIFIGGDVVPLIYVGDDSPGYGQINFILPDDLTPGSTEMIVLAGDGRATLGTLDVANVSPGVFTLNQRGNGLPVGLTTTDGINYSYIWDSEFAPKPIDVGSVIQPTYFSFFGTGWRHRTTLGNVTVTIGGVPVEVLFLGEQGGFAGLDQCNVKIPLILAGGGPLELVITVDGREANRTMITIL